jgi:uncharacterized protein (TIGR03067 family)
MKRSPLMLFLALSFFPFFVAGCGSSSDKEVLQGAWYMVSEEADGKATPMDQINTLNPRLIFQGENYGFKAGGQTVERGTFTVDSSKSPRAISLKPKGSFTEGATKAGIYDLQEDILLICIGELNKEGPKAFKTELNSGNELKKYKRVPK